MPERAARAFHDVIRALRPTGLWYGVVTLMVAIVVWTYGGAGTAWASWPVPLQVLVWGWLVLTFPMAPAYIALTQGVPAIRDLWKAYQAQQAAKRGQVGRRPMPQIQAPAPPLVEPAAGEPATDQTGKPDE